MVQDRLRAAWEAVDEADLVELSLKVIETPSPTGEELAMAELLAGELSRLGLETRTQEVEEGRANVVGLWRGDGSGPRLMLNGHLDVPYSGLEPEWPAEPPPYPPRGYVDGRWIHGTGIFNMKGALVAYVVALGALKAAGVRLKGDVLFAGVAGENGLAQVDTLKGRRYRGGGVGTQHLLTHGGLADLALIGEPTALRLFPAHQGPLWWRVTVRTPADQITYAAEAPDALARLRRVETVLLEWGERFSREHVWMDRPAQVRVSGVQAGWPYRLSHIPFKATLYLDVRTSPHQRQMDVVREVEAVLTGLRAGDPDLDLEWELFQSIPGSEVLPDAPICQVVLRAHRAVFGEDPVVVAAGWQSDASILTRYGIPAVHYGPSGRRKPGARELYAPASEHISLDDLLQCTKVYCAVILDVCGES